MSGIFRTFSRSSHPVAKRHAVDNHHYQVHCTIVCVAYIWSRSCHGFAIHIFTIIPKVTFVVGHSKAHVNHTHALAGDQGSIGLDAKIIVGIAVLSIFLSNSHQGIDQTET